MKLADIIALALGVTAALAPNRTLAQEDCEPPPMGRRPLRVTPASGATGVTLDAPIKVEYTEGFFSEGTEGGVELEVRDTAEPVAGSREVVDDQTLLFFPDGLLQPNTAYEGTALGLDFDLPFNFRTGGEDSLDTEAPDLGEIREVNSSRVDPRCGAPEGGYRIDVSFNPATDDGPAGSIEYLLYQTRGPDVQEPVLRARTRNFTTDLITMAFVLEPSEAVEPICVAIQAVDGVGRVDNDGEPRCFDPIQGNFFEPLCTVGSFGASRAASGAWGSAGVLVGFALVLAGRRRRRR